MAEKQIAQNKKAYFDYEIIETFEAGLVLTGSEVKSLRAGHGSLLDSFCFVQNGELFLKNCLIAGYDKGSHFNEDERRDRKLLMHKKEIARLTGKTREKGYTLVPLKLYFKGRTVKALLGFGRGKHSYDKKRVIKERDLDRDMQREIKNYK